MKIKNIACVASLLFATLPAAQAQTTIAKWTFEGLTAAINTNPPANPNNSAGNVSAACIGMQQFGGGTTNAPDVLLGKSSDTGANGIADATLTWRLRGVPGNGWISTAPVGTQGAQFSADTSGYTGIQVGFDWYATTQGEANMQLQYTTDNWAHTNNIAITVPAAESVALVNSNNVSGSDPNSVQGYYVSDNALLNGSTAGQDWFTNLTATISDPAAANNPLFAIRIVNASTGASCVSAAGTALNNTSGNWRLDNIVFSGTASSSITPPTIIASTVATVDGPFTNTFTDDSIWRSKIGRIQVNGVTLPSSAYAISAGMIIYTPSASTLLQTAGTISVLISSTNYSGDVVSQFIAPGAAKQLKITTQPIAPTGNGGTLVAQPALSVLDQYNNAATNCSANYTANPSSGWGFGLGSGVTQPLINGLVIFTNLSATNLAAVSGAAITFTANSIIGLGALAYTTTNSSVFNLPAPATTGFTHGNLTVFQEDVAAKNSTFSILEVNPASGALVNTFPISATGANALRTSSAATTGRMSDSADGTFVCFTGFETQDGSLVTTPDVTFVNPRGVGTLDASGTFVLQTSYIGDGTVSQNQTRSATTLDNLTWYVGDKGGVYTNNSTLPSISVAGNNVRSMKSFGGQVYFLQQASGKVVQVPISYVNGSSYVPLSGFSEESNCLDFYMVQSGANGSTYDTLYYIDGTGATSSTSAGGIFKYYFTGTYDPDSGAPVWAQASGSPMVAAQYSGDGLCAAANSAGGIDLYYTTGTGGIAGNSLVKATDSGATNVLNLGTTNILYTVSSSATLKGVTFAPIAIVTNVVFNPNTSSVSVGNTTSLAGEITILPANAATKTVTWFSDNTPVATVDINGVVTGVSAGMAHVSATTMDGSNLSATNLVTVTAASTVITPLTITSGSVHITGSGASASASFSFTNAPGLSFSILGTNNLTAPMATWPVVGTAIENPAGSGNYQFTDPNPATNSARYYILRQP